MSAEPYSILNVGQLASIPTRPTARRRISLQMASSQFCALSSSDPNGAVIDDGRQPFRDVTVSRAQLLLVTSAMAGIQVCYSVQINHGTPALLALGLSEAAVALAWLAGPLSGLIVQPIVGVASDSCTSTLGRRTPFLIVGLLLTATALLMFPNAAFIARLLVKQENTNNDLETSRSTIALAIFAFFLLDFSIQVIQAPLRALVTDIAPGAMLPVGNAYLALFVGAGNLVGSLLSTAKLSTHMTFFASDLQALFTIAALFLILMVSVSILAADEVPLHLHPEIESHAPSTQFERIIPGSAHTPVSKNLPVLLRSEILAADPGHIDSKTQEDRSQLDVHNDDDEGGGSHDDHPRLPLEQSSLYSICPPRRSDARKKFRLTKFYRILIDAPRPFWRVFAVQLFTWFGFFSLFVYINAWVGINIYLGQGKDPQGSLERSRFEDGVRLGGVGNALTAVVTIVYSQFIASMIDRFGILTTYGLSQFIEAACLMAAYFIRGAKNQDRPPFFLKAAAVLDIGMFGIVWATTMGVPWAIIGQALNDDQAYQLRVGLFTTIFNASQSFPQLLMALMSPVLLRHFGNDVSAVMFIGGILALFGGLLVFILRGDKLANGKPIKFSHVAGTTRSPFPNLPRVNAAGASLVWGDVSYEAIGSHG